MNALTLEKMLLVLDIEANQWTTDSQLYTISMTTDGTHHYDPLSQRLYFDLTNQLLKIKYFTPILVSSYFWKAKKTAASTFEITPDIFGNYSVKMINQFDQFRNPKIGDIAFTVDANGNFVEARTITNIEGTVMTLSSDIDVTNKKLCYASGVVLTLSLGTIVPKTAGQFLESFDGKDALLVLKRPTTNNIADIYISTPDIEGFGLRRFNSLM